jgi:hypothetical protein
MNHEAWARTKERQRHVRPLPPFIFPKIRRGEAKGRGAAPPNPARSCAQAFASMPAISSFRRIRSLRIVFSAS